jgi:glycosyltransferase involved in cell wall biosynthesis
MTQNVNFQYRVSVCLASYNGEKFIHKQIESIISDLGQFDELIICDDCSVDNTCSIIRSFNDARIKLICNQKRLGFVKNFEKLITLATGDLIFLSDQDNIWIKGKIEKVISVFQKDSSIRLVCHSFIPIDAQENRFPMNVPLMQKGKKSSFAILIQHLIKSQLYGCTFCMNRKTIDYLLPFPLTTYSHDHWILVSAAVNGYIFVLDESLIKYRRHDSNLSPLKRFPVKTMLLFRIKLFLQICTAIYRSGVR